MSKHWSGQTCPKTANYGQYNDATNKYAGIDRSKCVYKVRANLPTQHFD